MIRRLALALSLTLAAPALAADVDVPALWKKHCKGCHGETGKADTPNGKKHKVEDMTTAKWQEKHDDEKIKKGINEGVPKTKMKAFKDKLSAEEVDAIIKHIRTLKG